MSRLRTLISIELDDDRLDEYRDELLDAGEVLYTEDPFGGSKDMKHWPGQPEEWTSIHDLVDLIEAKAIVRTEILSVTEAPAGLDVERKPRRWWEVWKR